MQPGDTIKPTALASPETPATPEVVVHLNQASTSLPQPVSPPLAPPLPAVQPVPQATTEPLPPIELPPAIEQSQSPQPSTWQFTNATEMQPPPAQQSAQEISWSASEYVAHQKNTAWFVGLGLIVAAVTIIVYFITHDYFSPIMIAVLGVVFGVFAGRPPRVLNYKVNSYGINVGSKFYAYESFKTFSVVQDAAVHSIILSPLQRFMPLLTVYYDPKDEDKITDVVGNYLPFEEAKLDTVDNIMRRVRF